MIVGGLGPKAVSAFNQAGVEVFVGAVGTVKDAVDDWQAKMLTRADLENAWKTISIRLIRQLLGR